MSENKFKSRGAFIFASIGASVGLGNALRFPGLCARYGGGAFIAVYFFAAVVLGIPILNAEIALGRKAGGGAPKCMKSLKPSAEKVGWACSFNALAVAIIFAGLAGWLISQAAVQPKLCRSAENMTRSEIAGYFFGGVLGKKAGVYIAVFAVWAVIFALVSGGANALSKMSRFSVLIPVALLAFLAVKGMAAEGGGAALRALFVPDFSAFGQPDLWINAFGQVFFSLSILVGVMPAYGAYLPEKTNIFKDSLIIAGADFFASLLASVVLFTTLYSCDLAGAVEESGLVTAFSVYPAALSRVFGVGNAAANSVVSVLFYCSLALMATQSAASMAEALLNPLCEKFGAERKKAALAICLFGAAVSMVFATGAGKAALDVADHFINYFGVLALGLAECVCLGSTLKTNGLYEEINRYTGKLKLTRPWLTASLKVLCPVFLSVLLILGAAGYIAQRGLYGGYPVWVQIAFGWAWLGAVFAAGAAAAKLNSKRHIRGAITSYG